MKPLLFFVCLTALFPLLARSQSNATAFLNQDSLTLCNAGDTVSSGNKKLTYPTGKLLTEGTLVNWLREGWWMFYREDGSKASEVNFVHGQGAEMKTFDEQGVATGTFQSVEQDAIYQGGDGAWNNYVRQSLMDKMDYLVRKKANGHVEAQFIIEKDGSVGDVTLVKRTGTAFDDVVLDIIRKSARWEPAVQYNRVVKAFRRQSLSFQAPNN
jgi:hypothetical protein